ncbi:MAG: LarC family nickel insertion protein [Lachnospiraceae bacterium]|nr:LarC family nickel insertion protein [Lachnospiraceae bacterium]
MNTLYLECSSGISGDMTVAALLDLGADEEILNKALSGIKDESFRTEISRVKKSGIDCCDFNVILNHSHENHDHDMEYLYGHADTAAHDGKGDKAHEEHHHHHHHHHRNLKDVTGIINSLDISEKARDLAVKIFTILAESEAKAHNRPIEEVHFHEVGAIDSIVDVVAAAVCFDNLKIDEVIIPKICEGTGTVRCQHGVLPVPVPAVLNIAEKYKLPLSIMDRQGEYVTPTGAAFAAAVMTSKELPEIIIPKKTGLGAGKREHELPGILRAILI